MDLEALAFRFITKFCVFSLHGLYSAHRLLAFLYEISHVHRFTRFIYLKFNYFSYYFTNSRFSLPNSKHLQASDLTQHLISTFPGGRESFRSWRRVPKSLTPNPTGASSNTEMSPVLAKLKRNPAPTHGSKDTAGAVGTTKPRTTEENLLS